MHKACRSRPTFPRPASPPRSSRTRQEACGVRRAHARTAHAQRHAVTAVQAQCGLCLGGAACDGTSAHKAKLTGTANALPGPSKDPRARTGKPRPKQPPLGWKLSTVITRMSMTRAILVAFDATHAHTQANPRRRPRCVDAMRAAPWICWLGSPATRHQLHGQFNNGGPPFPPMQRHAPHSPTAAGRRRAPARQSGPPSSQPAACGFVLRHHHPTRTQSSLVIITHQPLMTHHTSALSPWCSAHRSLPSARRSPRPCC